MYTIGANSLDIIFVCCPLYYFYISKNLKERERKEKKGNSKENGIKVFHADGFHSIALQGI
jgi:hypothetical protein